MVSTFPYTSPLQRKCIDEHKSTPFCFGQYPDSAVVYSDENALTYFSWNKHTIYTHIVFSHFSNSCLISVKTMIKRINFKLNVLLRLNSIEYRRNVSCDVFCAIDPQSIETADSDYYTSWRDN